MGLLGTKVYILPFNFTNKMANNMMGILLFPFHSSIFTIHLIFISFNHYLLIFILMQQNLTHFNHSCSHQPSYQLIFAPSYDTSAQYLHISPISTHQPEFGTFLLHQEKKTHFRNISHISAQLQCN